MEVDAHLSSGFNLSAFIARHIEHPGSLHSKPELIKILSENKVRVLKLNKFNPELTLKKGTYTKVKPTLIEKKEIKLGIDVLKKTNSYDHIQALVVRNKKVIAIEKNSGTIISNVSKKLDYLIIGEKPTKRKVETAKELKIKILKQSEWLNLLNKTS